MNFRLSNIRLFICGWLQPQSKANSHVSWAVLGIAPNIFCFLENAGYFFFPSYMFTPEILIDMANDWFDMQLYCNTPSQWCFKDSFYFINDIELVLNCCHFFAFHCTFPLFFYVLDECLWLLCLCLLHDNCVFRRSSFFLEEARISPILLQKCILCEQHMLYKCCCSEYQNRQ